MAITVNNKKIRSLPEQVAENSKKIKELETPQELYQYNIYIEFEGTNIACFDIYSHDGELAGTSMTTVDQLQDLFDQIKFEYAAASGYCGEHSTIFLQAHYDTDTAALYLLESDGSDYDVYCARFKLCFVCVFKYLQASKRKASYRGCLIANLKLLFNVSYMNNNIIDSCSKYIVIASITFKQIQS